MTQNEPTASLQYTPDDPVYKHRTVQCTQTAGVKTSRLTRIGRSDGQAPDYHWTILHEGLIPHNEHHRTVRCSQKGQVRPDLVNSVRAQPSAPDGPVHHHRTVWWYETGQRKERKLPANPQDAIQILP